MGPRDPVVHAGFTVPDGRCPSRGLIKVFV
jgi:hypothetical protein